jgi:hypothetical protein
MGKEFEQKHAKTAKVGIVAPSAKMPGLECPIDSGGSVFAAAPLRASRASVHIHFLGSCNDGM